MEVVIVIRTPYSSASLRGLPMMMMIVVAMMVGIVKAFDERVTVVGQIH